MRSSVVSVAPQDIPFQAPADCQSCGACCFSESPTYVRVTGDDWTRLGPQAEQLAHFVGNRAFMRMRERHCAALEVRQSRDHALGFVCTIYDRRPQACRDLDRGSAECAGEIATKSAIARAAGSRKTHSGNTENWGRNTLAPSVICIERQSWPGVSTKA